MALASSHEALTKSGWRGTTLEEIVRAACRPFVEAGHIEIDGELVELRSRAVVSMARMLHELATNASKYGSLSVTEGRVRVRWRVEHRDEAEVLIFEWKERDGPPVGPSGKKGFGSLLISSIVEQDLHPVSVRRNLAIGWR